jgi:hypothetical protein
MLVTNQFAMLPKFFYNIFVLVFNAWPKHTYDIKEGEIRLINWVWLLARQEVEYDTNMINYMIESS